MRKSFAFLSSLALSLTFASSSLTAFAAPYELGFDTRPSYIPSNVVVLTFDDGPDWVNTAKVLDTLKQKNVKASFYINSENWSSLSQDQPMRDLVKRMVNEGHELANHTAHHNHLPELSASTIESEIADVENNVKNIFGNGAPRLTLLRAPHGEPYQNNDPSNPTEAYKLVSPIVAKHAVHIGWNIDSADWVCSPGDADCVYNNVTSQLQSPGQGSYGIILMHSVHSQTADALSRLIDYIRARGFQIWTTEDVVRARYGKSSLELISGSAPSVPTTPTRPTTPTTPSNYSAGAVAPQVGGVYNLVSKSSGKCLDIDGPTVNDSARAQQWACADHQANQLWRVEYAGHGSHTLVSVNSDKCLDVRASGTVDGTQVQQYTCNSTLAQRVTLYPQTDGSYKLAFHVSGQCLDVAGGSQADGGNVQTWTCNDNAHQRWFFKP